MGKLKDLFLKLKSNWNTPSEGYFVSYKEFLYFALGQGYIKALKIRKAVTNFEKGNLSEEDKANIKELVDFARETNDGFITEELKRHSVIDEIYAL